MTLNFILIDGSYFVFYRYYALRNWWRHAKLENEEQEPCKNSRFMEKFNSTFCQKIKELDKKLGIKNSIKIVGKDCSHKDIWRTKLFPSYKGNRHGEHSTTKDSEDIKLVFKNTYNFKDLFKEAGIETILSHPELEGDDCIAITSKYIINKYPEAHVWIITSDMDYLQLSNDRIHLYDLKFNDLSKSKKVFDDPQKNLFCKIVAGDKSDNIPPVFPKCGIKTAEKYYNDNELFTKKLNEKQEFLEQYNLNKKLVDFNNIPEELVNSFKKDCLHL